MRDGDGDSDDHNNNHSGVDRVCEGADDGNDHDSVGECGPLALFTLTDQMQLFIHQIQKRRSGLDLSGGTATVLFLKHSLNAWSGPGSCSDSSSRRQMLFVHILYSLQRLSY